MKQKRFFVEDIVAKGELKTEGDLLIESAEIYNYLKTGSVEVKSPLPLNLNSPISNTEIYSFPVGLYNLAEFTVTLVDSENSYVFGQSFSVGHNGSSVEISAPFAIVDLWGTIKPTFSSSIVGDNVKLFLTANSDSLSVSLAVKLHSSEVSYFINISSQPTAVSVVEGDVPATFSVVAATNDGGTLGYQWQGDTGSGFTDLVNDSTYSGSLTNTLTVTTSNTSLTGSQYRCRVSSSGSSPDEITSAAVLTVSAAQVNITSNPSNQTVNGGESVQFSVGASTNETLSTLTYSWEENSGSGFIPLTANATYSGVNSSTLTIVSSAGLNGYSYRCRVSTTSSSSPEEFSNSATLTVL